MLSTEEEQESTQSFSRGRRTYVKRKLFGVVSGQHLTRVVCGATPLVVCTLPTTTSCHGPRPVDTPLVLARADCRVETLSHLMPNLERVEPFQCSQHLTLLAAERFF